jgi:menaquinone-dependent protoporphyrinogen IX oxidase
MSILKIFGIILAIIVVVAVVIWGVTYANSLGSETLKSSENITGKALIVYDPGWSGATKNIATKMGQELQSKGYEVTVAGVRSVEASNITGYNLLIFGSPTYVGNPSGLINSYIENLNLPQNVTVGVFTVGSVSTEDSNLVLQQLLQNKTVAVKISKKFDQSAVQNNYTTYINAIRA